MSCTTTAPSELEGTRSLMHLKVSIPGHRSAIAPLVGTLMQLIRETGCAGAREFAIEIALLEALANAVVHGCGDDPSKVVECALSCSESGELTIVVRDPGPGFDPGSVPDPMLAENVHSHHGRGIHLIKQVAHAVWFECGGNEIHIVLEGARTLKAPDTERSLQM